MYASLYFDLKFKKKKCTVNQKIFENYNKTYLIHYDLSLGI